MPARCGCRGCTPLVDRHASGVPLAASVVALAATLLVGNATAASAHAALMASRPEPGTQLTAAPGVVEIEFSEPLIAGLSSMTVTDPDGTAWQRTGVGKDSMQARLDTNSQGVYSVEWKTVSPLDGHALRGSFRFGVGVTPSNVEASATIAPGTADVLLAVARAIEYAGLLVAVGMILVLALARRDPPLGWVRPRLGATLTVALVAGLMVTSGEAVLAAPGAGLSGVGRYLTAQPGVRRLIRLGAELVALLAARSGAPAFAGAGLVVAIGGLAAAGHAAAARPSWWGIFVDAVHLLAAGMWAGAILAFATLRPPGSWRGEPAKHLLRRFSPVAVGAFVVTVAFGTLRGTQELVSVRDLVSTSYGRVLSLKILAVALMVPPSLRAWRRRDARPRAEGILALVAIGAAALLAAYPVPPQRAAQDVQAAGDAGRNAALPRSQDLTMATNSGDVLVALTLRPGRLGRNDVLVFVLPPQGEKAASNLAAEVVLDGDRRALAPCGSTCRRGEAVLDSQDELEVRVAGVAGEPARFMLPELPAPDGRELMQRAVATMGALDSLRYEEVFGPVEPPIRSTVAMVAPDRLRAEVHTFRRVTIRIGDTTYRREGDGEWEVEPRGAQVNVPLFVWDYTPRIAAHIVGRGQVDGVATRILSFFIDHATSPIWYRLWVDDDGLVRRAEMHAQGHFMQHHYSGFNAPIEIAPPAPVETPEASDDEPTA